MSITSSPRREGRLSITHCSWAGSASRAPGKHDRGIRAGNATVPAPNSLWELENNDQNLGCESHCDFSAEPKASTARVGLTLFALSSPLCPSSSPFSIQGGSGAAGIFPTSRKRDPDAAVALPTAGRCTSAEREQAGSRTSTQAAQAVLPSSFLFLLLSAAHFLTLDGASGLESFPMCTERAAGTLPSAHVSAAHNLTDSCPPRAKHWQLPLLVFHYSTSFITNTVGCICETGCTLQARQLCSFHAPPCDPSSQENRAPYL